MIDAELDQLPPDVRAQVLAFREAEALQYAVPITDDDANDGIDPDVLDVVTAESNRSESNHGRKRVRTGERLSDVQAPKDGHIDLGDDKLARLYGDATDGYHIVSRGHGGTRGFPRRRSR